MEFNGAHETLVIKEIYLIDTNILIRIKLSLMHAMTNELLAKCK